MLADSCDKNQKNHDFDIQLKTLILIACIIIYYIVKSGQTPAQK